MTVVRILGRRLRAIRKLVVDLALNRKSVYYSTHFNTPIKFIDEDWYVNERIVELAFVHNQIELDGQGKRVLEFGCTRSDLVLQLAALGYQVVGVDLREYKFAHPRLALYQGNILDFQDSEGFDYITAVSTIEHIGLGAYGEGPSTTDLVEVTSKLCRLLKSGGKIIVTVPFGIAYEDEFLRSFTHEGVLSLFDSDALSLVAERFYYRVQSKFWQPCDIEVAQGVSNAKAERVPTGVNCVGCFVWRKQSSPVIAHSTPKS
jgi:SAM-dependent methyltransferase